MERVGEGLFSRWRVLRREEREPPSNDDSYSELSREDQLKDIYTIKDLLTTEMWGLLDGYEYEEEFEKWDIGW